VAPSDLDEPTLRLVAACREYEAREFGLCSATVYGIARGSHPHANVEAALHFLGLPSLYPEREDPAMRWIRHTR